MRNCIASANLFLDRLLMRNDSESQRRKDMERDGCLGVDEARAEVTVTIKPATNSISMFDSAKWPS